MKNKKIIGLNIFESGINKSIINNCDNKLRDFFLPISTQYAY
jgi:hypothetical protein